VSGVYSNDYFRYKMRVRKKKRKNQGDREKEIAKTILKSIGLAAVVASVIVFPGLAHVVKWVEDSTKDNSPRARRSFNRLKTRGMIKLVEKRGKYHLFLTKKGKKRFNQNLLADLKIKKPESWDGR